MKMSYEATVQKDDIFDILIEEDLHGEVVRDIEAKVERIYELGVEAGKASVKCREPDD